MAAGRQHNSRHILATSWLFLPWLEILQKFAGCAFPLSEDLSRGLRRPAVRPSFQEMTEEMESHGYIHLEDVGRAYQENRHFYRVFIDQSAKRRPVSASQSRRTWLSII